MLDNHVSIEFISIISNSIHLGGSSTVFLNPDSSDGSHIGIIIKASSLKHRELLDHPRLSAQLIVEGEVNYETKSVASESMEGVWKLSDSIQL